MPDPSKPPRRRFRSRAMITLGLAGIVTVASVTLPPATFRRTGPAANEITRGPVGQHHLALTFDAGGGVGQLPELLAALAAARVHCTFFLTGHWASHHPALAREIISRGHEIGNHSWSHLDLTRLSSEQVRSEILGNDKFLSAILDHSPRPLFRVPFGARHSRILRILGELGYTSIYWTLDSLDSIDPPKTPEYLVARVTGRPDAALDGAIILLHVGEPATAAAVPAILANLQRRGFKMGTVSELLRLP